MKQSVTHRKGFSPYSWLIIPLVLLSIVVVAGWSATGYLGNKARQELIKDNESVISILSVQIADELKKIEGVVAVLSGSPWIYPALVSGKDQDIARANSALDRYNTAMGATVSYLTDSTGKTIASSNRNDPDSFVGKSYHFRPYFIQAMNGSPGRYFASGVTSLKRGVYAGFPVRKNNGAVIGVVAMKKELDEKENLLAEYPLCFFIDPHGIIFLSSKKEMILKSLWPIDRKTAEELTATRQFGAGPFDAVMQREVADGMTATLGGTNYLVSRRVIDPEGWSMVLMTPTDRIVTYRSFAMIITIGICLLIIIVTAFLHAIFSAADKMRESEDRFRRLADATWEGIIIHREGIIVDVNESASKMFGYTAEEVIGQSLMVFLAPESIEPALQILKESIDTPNTSFEVQGLRKDKTVFPVQVLGGQIRYKNYDARVVALRDITERKQVEAVLRESEEKHRLLFDSAGDAIFVIDTDARMLAVNALACERLGYTHAELMSMTIGQVDSSTEATKVQERMALLMEHGHHAFETMHQRKDGSLIPTDVRARRITWDGRPAFVSICRDITERKQAESQREALLEALEEGEERYRLLFEDAVDGMAVGNAETGELTDCNHALCSMVERDRTELIGQHQSILHPQDHLGKGLSPSFRLHKAGDKVQVLEDRLVSKSGKIIPVEINATKIKIRGHEHLLGIFRDITERKQVEEKLNEAQTRMQYVISSSPVITYTVTLDYAATWVTQNVESILGYTVAECLAPGWWADHLHPDDKDSIFSEMRGVFKSGRNIHEYRFQFKDGSYRWIQDTQRLLSDEQGNPTEIIGAWHDITERKRVESQREAALEALRESTEKQKLERDRLGLILKTAQDGFWLVDASTGRLLDVNDAACSMLGYSREELLRIGLTDLDAQWSPEELGQEMQKIKTVGNAFFETRQRTRSGQIIDVEVSVNYLPAIDQFFSFVHDITDRKRAESQREAALEALRESEKKYSELAQFLPQIVFETDMKGNMTFVNDAAYSISGYSPEEFKKGLNVLQVIAPEDRDRARLNIQRILHGEELRSNEYTFLRKDGSTFPMLTETIPIVRNNQTLGLRGLVIDITDRKRAEEKLRESEANYRQLFDNAPSAIYQVDFRTGKLIKANDVFCEHFGCSQKEITSLSPSDILTEESKKSFFERMNKMVLGEEVPENPEYEVIKRDGKRVWVKLTAKYIYDSGGLAGANVVVHDIDDLKRAEEQIREYSENLEKMVEERTEELGRSLNETEEAREKIDGIVKSVADGLIVTDPYNHIVMMNPAAEDLLNVRFSDVMHRPIEEAIGDETLRERLKETLDRKITGEQFDFELPGIDTDHSRIMRARTSVVRGMKGEDAGIVTIMTDVTHEREVDRMKTEFVSTAAHELRTPLTSILGFSELLVSRDDITEDERKKFLSYINEKSKHLNALITDILDISRIEGGQEYSLAHDLFDMGELIGETVSHFKKRYGERPFIVTLPEGPVELTADRKKLHQVLRNLISNAVKFSPEKSPVKVTAERSKDSYQVSIRDEGIGMSPEQVEKMFDKFYRADSSTTAVSGTGLGMSIVKYIVEANGGTVWIESEPGKGTTVRFTVPA